ncbi:hypothetical protein EAG_11663 [Camponotus floridanus]|uniref:Uncharacterized protein n=1 Tax=Camponotus floridanus TaxID=104421 RepID=E2AR73_CAMFO|nr:hypothetical protein EAG_11663 [Camponotus floridanus]
MEIVLEEKWKESTGGLKSEVKVLSKKVCWREEKEKGVKRKVGSTRRRSGGQSIMDKNLDKKLDRTSGQNSGHTHLLIITSELATVPLRLNGSKTLSTLSSRENFRRERTCNNRLLY